MADIQPPDLETKMAILDKKAEAECITLPDDVRTFMASKTKSNVRELEGALIKLIAYSSLTGTPINLQMAQQVLKHLVHIQDRRITIDSIQKASGWSVFRLSSPAQGKKQYEESGLPAAGGHVTWSRSSPTPPCRRSAGPSGNKHHTTVIHSINKIDQSRQIDPDLNRMIHNLMDLLQ